MAKHMGGELNINVEEISINEIKSALKLLKNRKSPGVDEITAEVLKVDTETTATVFHSLFQHIWKHQAIPADWTKGIVIKLPKKGDLSDCNNWRGITLLSVPSKVFLRVILNRIDKAIDAKLRNEQAGFISNGGCIDHIFTIRLFGVLRHFQHCTGHITTGSWKGRGNQYIEFARVVYCKLPTNGKQLPAFPLTAMTGIEPRPQRWEARVLPLPPWPLSSSPSETSLNRVLSVKARPY